MDWILALAIATFVLLIAFLLWNRSSVKPRSITFVTSRSVITWDSLIFPARINILPRRLARSMLEMLGLL